MKRVNDEKMNNHTAFSGKAAGLSSLEAERLIREGKASSVLVGLHNHVPPTFKVVLDQQGITEQYEIYSKSIIIKSAL